MPETFSGEAALYLVHDDITPGWYRTGGTLEEYEHPEWERRSILNQTLESSNSYHRLDFPGANAKQRLTITAGSGDAEYELRYAGRSAFLEWDASLESVQDSINTLIGGIDPFGGGTDTFVEVTGTPGQIYWIEYTGMLGLQQYRPEVTLYDWYPNGTDYFPSLNTWTEGADPRMAYLDPYSVEILPSDYAFYTRGLKTWEKIADPVGDCFVRVPGNTWRPVTRFPLSFRFRNRVLAPDPGSPGYYSYQGRWANNYMNEYTETKLRIAMPGNTWHEIGGFKGDILPNDKILDAQKFPVNGHGGNNIWLRHGMAHTVYHPTDDLTDVATQSVTYGFNPSSYSHGGFTGWINASFGIGSGWGSADTGEEDIGVVDERWLAYLWMFLDFDYAKFVLDHQMPPGTSVYFQFATRRHFAHRNLASLTFHRDFILGAYDTSYTGQNLYIYNSDVPVSIQMTSGAYSIPWYPQKFIHGAGSTDGLIATIPLDQGYPADPLGSEFNGPYFWRIPLDVSAGGAPGLKFVTDQVTADMISDGTYGRIGVDLGHMEFVFVTPNAPADSTDFTVL